MMTGPRRLQCGAALLLLLAEMCVARQQDEGPQLPDGATLVVQLEQEVRADQVKAGDEVLAKVIAPAVVRGKVVVPINARVQGVVVHAEPLTPAHPSRLVLMFRHAKWHSVTVALHAYMTRQLVIQRTYSHDAHLFCPPITGLAPAQANHGALAGLAKPSSDALGAADCQAPFGSERDGAHALTFVSPSIAGVVFRKAASGGGPVVLEAARRHIGLRKGMMLEIRHSPE